MGTLGSRGGPIIEPPAGIWQPEPGSEMPSCHPVEWGVWVTDDDHCFGDLCRDFSLTHGGQWRHQDHQINWQMGSRWWVLLRREAYQHVLAARATCAAVGVEGGWTIGRCARSILASLGPPMRPLTGELAIIDRVSYGYYDCRPCTLPDATSYDVSAYYYSILCRLNTWRMHWTDNLQLVKLTETDADVERRRYVMSAIGHNKTLRNTLVGCMIGALHESPYYFRGNLCWGKPQAGPFRVAGLLTVRLGWELTRLEALACDSWHTVVDGLICDSAIVPHVWEDHGLTVRRQHSGDAEICGANIYRVGKYETGWYAQGSRLPMPIERHAAPEYEYRRYVLGNRYFDAAA